MKKLVCYSLLLSLTTLLTACVSQPTPHKQAYLLKAPAPSIIAKKTTQHILMIPPVNIVPQFSGREFVYHKANGTYQSDFYHTFFIPPAEHFRELLSQAMTQTHLFKQVIQTSATNTPDRILQTEITQWVADYTRPTPAAIISVKISLMKQTDHLRSLLSTKTYTESSPIVPENTDGLLQAWQQDLDKIMARISTNLRPALHTTSSRSHRAPR